MRPDFFPSNKLRVNITPFLTALVALFLFQGMTKQEAFDFYKAEHCSAQVSCQPTLACDTTPSWEVFSLFEQNWKDLDFLPVIYQETSGLITIPADRFETNSGWADLDEVVQVNNPDGTVSNITQGYLQSLPDVGVNYGSAIEKTVAGQIVYAKMAQYRINFIGGTYYLWMKGNNPSGSSDSIQYGVDGERINSLNFYKKIWSNTIQDTGARATITVTAGIHVLNIFEREDGTRFDKIILTNNQGY